MLGCLMKKKIQKHYKAKDSKIKSNVYRDLFKNEHIHPSYSRKEGIF